MMTKHRILFSVLILLLTGIRAFASGDDGFRIEVKIEGLRDTTVFLGYHYGERQFLKDTAMVDSKGLFVFEGEKRLEPGMYLVILPESIYFELLIDQNQHFSVTTDNDQLIEKLQFENSPDNAAFYEYIRKLPEVNEKVALLRSQLQDNSLEEEQIQELTAALQETEHSVVEMQDSYMERFPDGLFTRILLAQRSPDMSDITPPAGGDNDPNYMYRQYKRRFWDHIDFSDDRLLRTPVYHSMLNRYINQFVIQIPDSIIVAADNLLEKSRAHPENFRYTLWFITNNAERSQIMGMDAVFVHLVEQYYQKGDAFWITEEGLGRLTRRAEQLSPVLIGRKAPDLFGFSTSGSRINLHDSGGDYTVIYFWESDCAHCKRETPVLKGIYEKYRDAGLNVFAMNVETDPEKWKKAIENYGLTWTNVNDIYDRSGFRDTYDVYAIPLIYLLDKDKKIIAKKISAEQLDGFMQFEMNRRKSD